MELESRTIAALLPEWILIITAVMVMVGGAFVRSSTGWTSVSAIALAVAGILLFRQSGPPWFVGEDYVTGTFSMDGWAATLRWVALAFGLGFVLMMGRSAGRDGGGEALGMLLVAIVGVMLSVAANDTVTLFMALEMISVPTYVLLFLGRGGRRSAEAAAKYFYLSILSSGFFLMALVLLYGLTGTTQISAIGASLASASDVTAVARPAMLATVLLVAALGFKITAVPFHFYAPDVYLATSNLNAGLLAVLPKVAGLVALARLSLAVVPALPDFGWQLLVIVSILTMSIGNIGALLQKNFRRLMAYSSIAHSGYMLIGLAVGLAGSDAALAYNGFSAAFLYLLVYGLASIGTFAALTDVEVSDSDSGGVSALAGLGKSRPWMAAVVGICMFSLAGLPPLAGFWGKLTLFSSALTAYRGGIGGGWFLALTMVAVINAVIAAAYYLRIVAAMYFNDNPRREDASVGIGAVAAISCSIAIVAFGLLPGGLVNHYSQIGPLQPPAVVPAAETTVQNAGLDDLAAVNPSAVQP